MQDSDDTSSVNVTCIVSKLFNNEEGYEILVKLAEPGYYHCSVKHMDKTLKTINAIVLTDKDTKRMEKNRKVLVFQIGYHCKKIKDKKKKDARCFISPTMLQVRRYNFFGITIKKYTFKVCRSTQFIMDSSPEIFTIDDGIIPPLKLTSPDRELIAAVYHYFMEKKFDECGFSFQDKRAYFQSKLTTNNNNDRSRIDINVARSQVVESAMEATKNFSKNDWGKNFFVKFDEEEGIDCNGVSREFINCLCDAIFSGRRPDGLFRAFKEDDMQSLVHPTTDKERNGLYDLRYYHFAGLIVGKCLYETAMGNTLLVRAKFTRSFLAQIIGLRLTWKYFETDDPHNGKVRYIKECSISDLGMDLTFTEEEYDGSSKNPRLVELVPNGTKKPVTESNKMYYLNKLAQYRLCSRVSKEIDEFMKGLNFIVPAELFGIFDENELELLMCGLQELSVQDLRSNAVVRGVSGQTIEWFWTSVNQLSQEELARLVQFVTGSSQVPIGGFAELQPNFTILCSGESGNRLPYAHTCFNHLCLPECESYEQFNNVLMTAIREGAEGLLMA
ncbi:PREDICTED: apoptosis-resistant E3 ubiquitin protein ligase 1-like [Amphimedon queenslandica]|uniref:HECT-type E3 ubiquitin transferase n=2 Tax=Amphimedon queenslandica TaxID=400682 RepID=A0AAN0JIF9_AMPQE|nr:PREDICTED: apoptosis-resistant E3 ubiquitin protein ligase 1-like [Amphimedon queenslandica]|eukprot:XP_019856800.1 PREDICTED: apoptosis-resistant E3 ubiquitin protein ligase 1-like [Amphimedon queenslandica]